jgi:hypothetical protein
MKFLSAILAIFVFLGFAIIILLRVLTPEPCEHEDTIRIYSFQFDGSTAAHSTREYCNVCKKNTTTSSTRFRGTPTDQSYLEVLVAQSDANEIIPGEYYTVTATVILGDYEYSETRLRCKVENDEFRVGFSVDFRDEFEEVVELVEEGDIITFRGRFYDEGCGFSDAELIK